jgi:hypothetical protein
LTDLSIIQIPSPGRERIDAATLLEIFRQFSTNRAEENGRNWHFDVLRAPRRAALTGKVKLARASGMKFLLLRQ